MTKPNETLSHDSIIESLEKAKETQHIDKHTLDQAREVLKDTNLSPEKSIKIQELITHLDNLNISTKSNVQETKDAVEMNPENTIKELESINLSKDLSKVTPEFTSNLKKQLDFCKNKHPEKYIKLITQLAELSVIYNTKLTNKETPQINHLDSLLNNQTKEFEIILTETSLDLENNTLERNLELFTAEKNTTKKNVILDYIYETEIEEKGYSVKNDKNNTFVVINKNWTVIKTDIISTLQQNISSNDLKKYNNYKESDSYSFINDNSLINWKTTNQLLRQSPEETSRDIKKLSETTGVKMLIPAAIIAFLFGVWTDMSFWKRLWWLIGGGFAFWALNASAKEMWHDGILSALPWLWSIIDTVDDFWKEHMTKSNNWKEDSSNLKVFEAITKLNNINANKLDNWDLSNLFSEVHKNETFHNITISQINSYINADGTIIARDLFWDKIPTDGQWKEYTHEKLKLFLQLLISTKDSSDKTWKDLLIYSYIAKGTDTERTEKNTPLAQGTDTERTKKEAPLAQGTDTERTKKEAPLAQGTEWEKKKIETLTYKTIWYFENGKSHLFADNSSDTPVKFEQLSESFKNTLVEYQWLTSQVDNLMFYLSTIWKEEELTLLEELNKSRESVQILQLEQTLPQLQNTVKSTIKLLPAWLDDFSDMNKVLKYLKEEKHYDAVKWYIVEENFDKLLRIKPEDLWNFINNNTQTDSIKELLKEDEDLYEKIREKKAEIDEYVDDNRELILSEYPDLDENEVIKKTKEIYIEGFTKDLLFHTYLEYHTKWSAKEVNIGNKQADLFWDIEWIGLWDIWEKNFDFWWKEAGIFVLTQVVAIAAWMVTMWAWTLAINAAVYGTRSVSVLKHMHTVWRLANNGNKLAKLARLAPVWAIWWASFNIWYTWVQSAWEWENLYTAEWFKDAALFWVALKWLWVFNTFVEKWVQFTRVNKLWALASKIPLAWKPIVKAWEAWVYTIKHSFNIWAPLLIAMWLDTWEWSIDNWEWLWDISFEPGEWTQEEILEALTLIATYKLMRGNNKVAKLGQNMNNKAAQAWKALGQKVNIKIKKGKSGRVEVQEWKQSNWNTKQEAPKSNQNNSSETTNKKTSESLPKVEKTRMKTSSWDETYHKWLRDN